MSRIYLQDKITPVAGKYIIVGSDGNLTTGDAVKGFYPTVTFTTATAIGVNKLSVVCESGETVVPSLIEGSTKNWQFSPSVFGLWTVTDSQNNQSGNVDVVDLTSYVITLSSQA